MAYGLDLGGDALKDPLGQAWEQHHAPNTERSSAHISNSWPRSVGVSETVRHDRERA